MAITPFSTLLNHARQNGYALGYFEAWDIYSLEASLEVAEETRSPLILGFGGAVTNPAWLGQHGVEEMAGLARLLAERASVPACVLFNEARTLDHLARGLRAGCNAVMLDTSHLPFAENAEYTRQVVALARPYHAEVEAELGHLADASGMTAHAAVATDPVEAARFVAWTGVDALAVSVGNVHVLSRGEAMIDLGALEAIRDAVSVPLVIHGGTGFPRSAVRAAVERGVAKFNVGTRLKRAVLDGVRDAANALPEPANVHDAIGSREPGDIFNQGKARLKDVIRELVALYGSAGRAGQPPA